MKRTWTVLLAASALAGFAAGSATASGTAATVQLRSTKLGKLLVNSKGFTVYAFTRDKRNSDSCVNIRGCMGTWPALTTKGKPTGGSGIKSSLLGTITLKGGIKQVTYAGHPLYTYSGDGSPGETAYVNASQFGGHWPALNASGGEVK